MLLSRQSKQIFQEWNHNADSEQTTNSSFHGTIYYIYYLHIIEKQEYHSTRPLKLFPPKNKNCLTSIQGRYKRYKLQP